jgi:hypothetical protein
MEASQPVFNFLASTYKIIQHDKDIFEITIHIRFERGNCHLEGEGCSLNGTNAGNMELLGAPRHVHVRI